MKPGIPQARVGNVNINFRKQAEIPEIIGNWRDRGHRGYVVLINPHSVMMCHRDSTMHDAATSADLVLPDGVGIVLAAQILGYGKQYRVTGPALMLQLCDAGRQMGLRHFFYGGREGVAETLAARLSQMFPGLQVAGTLCPPFQELSDEEDRQMVHKINAAHADVVWIGLGAPKQERWMKEHIGQLNTTAMIGVGAAFDFHSGNTPWAPRWIRSIGCEWAYRLAMEPRRMWRRNLDSPLFLGHILAQALSTGLRRLAGGIDPAFETITREPAPRFGGGDIDLGSGGGAVASGPSFHMKRPVANQALASVGGAA
jgi:N-acetylglucosaminyldiphosphoundecaprenol N-acetyl-beta-D-mannosaminyltransferase